MSNARWRTELRELGARPIITFTLPEGYTCIVCGDKRKIECLHVLAGGELEIRDEFDCPNCTDVAEPIAGLKFAAQGGRVILATTPEELGTCAGTAACGTALVWPDQERGPSKWMHCSSLKSQDGQTARPAWMHLYGGYVPHPGVLWATTAGLVMVRNGEHFNVPKERYFDFEVWADAL